MSELKNYIALVQEGEDETGRWYFECSAETVEHAEEQALDHSDSISVVAVFEQVKP